MTRRRHSLLLCAALSLSGALSLRVSAEELAPISLKEALTQPLLAQAKQLAETMELLGSPLPREVNNVIDKARADDADFPAKLQQLLDPMCLAMVEINPESRVKVAAGPAKGDLLEQGWKTFLIKVHNQAGVTAELKPYSPSGKWLASTPAELIADQWLQMEMFNNRPMNKKLSGLELEYRVIQLYSRDAGKRSAKISFNVGQGTQDLGFRNDIDVLFTAEPAVPVTFKIRDEHGQATTAAFVIKDRNGHVYPSQAKRLAPDFAFHPQVYRADGENIRLPTGEYSVEVSRGPEYLASRRTITVGKTEQNESFELKRWIDPSQMGWWSGDHHIHAAGCAHYSKPTEGVFAKDMFRHIVGEDLKVGCNLTWGPCFDFQKQFFTGAVDKVSTYPYLLRYDVEVSGFGSHQSGHLCLLRLKEELYPGGDSDKHWPTLGLNTLKWAKKQGAVCGPAHSGWGLEVKTTDLPNLIIPPFSGIGANEYIVDVTHQVPGPDGKLVPAVDFMSTVDTPYVWELNMWYHTLNCGFRTRISGETDFPCIYGERVGLGRSYVKLGEKLDFDAWCEGIRQGRCYVGDGRSHLIDFKVDDTEVGTNGSEVKLENVRDVRITAKAAALLADKPNEAIRSKDYSEAPYWNVERARVGNTQQVKVELVVNGRPVAEKLITADGKLNDISFTTRIDASSWVALRVLPSSHTNPIFITVGGKPIRASRQSAQWCLKGVDQCWSQKKRFYAPAEQADAKAAYDHARETYKAILQETVQE